MGLDYAYISIMRREYLASAYEFITAHGEMKYHDTKCAVLYFPLDEVIKEYLFEQGRGWFLANKIDKAYLTEENLAKIGCIYIHECPAPIGSDFVKLDFKAATTRMSYVFQGSSSVKEWFLNFSKAVGAIITYADFEDNGCSILFWKGKEVNITFSNDDDLSPAELVEIITFFAANSQKIQDDE